ncbi:hypothetical protein KR054_008919 [Drosophila jambulina]|nr:hypothetical protein KR054_008919 [Drosophila jambulina]
MHRLPPPTPSPVSTYCSDLEYKGCVGSQILRRSQRLIDKENQELARSSTPKCRSPQLFEESQDVYSQPLCQQEKPPLKVVHLKETDKVVSPKSEVETRPPKKSNSFDKVIDLEPSNRILHLKPTTSSQILHLKQLEEFQNAAPKKKFGNSKPSSKILQENVKKTPKKVQESVPQKNLKRKRTYQQSSQPAAKMRARTPLNRHEAVKTPLSKQHLSLTPTSSQSRLPLKYPEHFDKQVRDTSFVRVPFQELCPTPEPTPNAATRESVSSKSSPSVDSESSLTISLSDSICEIFGSKDVADILDIKSPPKYLLLDDHLPAVATMLNVDVDRLRNVLEITQRLSHEQILEFSHKEGAI